MFPHVFRLAVILVILINIEFVTHRGLRVRRRHVTVAEPEFSERDTDVIGRCYKNVFRSVKSYVFFVLDLHSRIL